MRRCGGRSSDAELLLLRPFCPVCIINTRGYDFREGQVATMYAQECLKRTAECARLAEATNDPGLREYLTKLALSWMQSTTTAERNERVPADGSQRRRLKTVHDLFC